MSLTLWFHPLSSFCHKVLVALYDAGIAFTPRHVNPGDPADRAALAGMSPLGKMPVLQDHGRDAVICETSLIIAYLARHDPGARRLLPADPDQAMQAHVWDRVFDMHVQGAMQPVVNARLFMDPSAEPAVTAFAHRELDRAYAAADRHLAGRDWLAGDFGLADCAALPALFYAGILHPFAAHPHLSSYFERLIARPSAARVLDEARPVLDMFPFAEKIPARFR
ncbi:glutathione S-transferase family protein [Paracoccus spongiarum]|uniref:Glutathione S-transferase family protein n=1 Tax=Paracoccus spongiarum TaxID=3064387 RepID=A0ABT9JIH7_9RHOB|nr:glutathione S-transferase family protein [Paracoccus sp. 2205BS29-5]MDP5308852.1 glutathione S-transferase family protein [Paracoccus sp. 2205BS29-5]